MRLPLAIATLFLAATTALPAFAATPAPLSASLRDASVTPIETVQYQQNQQQQTTRQRRQTRTYRNGYNSYAADPSARVYRNPWGRCVGGLGRSADSAFPSWDLCSGR